MDRHVFIARQPILDRARRVWAYELLFRASSDAEGAGASSEQASARVVTDAVMAFGLHTLTQGKPAFINATRRLLLDGLTGLEEILPPANVVVELLEDIEADDEVIEACRALKRAGYQLALDDFVLSDRTAALVPLVDYVKVDFVSVRDAERRRPIVTACADGGTRLLAEKVETVAQFDAALAEGFDYFQGYFFGRPSTFAAREIPGDRLMHLRLLKAFQDPELSLLALEQLVEHDPSLCYRILRTVNSAAFGQGSPITSIRQALVLMGVGVVRRWGSLWILAGLSDGAHPELLTMSAIRARCCELLAGARPGGEDIADGFLLGMCSLLDAILERPMTAVMEELPLSPGMRAALLGEDNAARRLLDCAIAYERGDWALSDDLAGRAGLEPRALAAAHGEAMRWSADFLRGA